MSRTSDIVRLPVRKSAWVTAAVCLVVFAVMAVLTVSGTLAKSDVSGDNWAYGLQRPGLTTMFIAFTRAGEWYTYVAVALVLFIVPKWRWKWGVPVAVVMVASGVLNTLLKTAFRIPRPDIHRLIGESGFSFPSGHSMNGAACAGICALLVWHYAGRRWVRAVVAVLLALFVLIVGCSRVYLGVHNPSDIIAGFAMGLCVAFAGWALSVYWERLWHWFVSVCRRITQPENM